MKKIGRGQGELESKVRGANSDIDEEVSKKKNRGMGIYINCISRGCNRQPPHPSEIQPFPGRGLEENAAGDGRKSDKKKSTARKSKACWYPRNSFQTWVGLPQGRKTWKNNLKILNGDGSNGNKNVQSSYLGLDLEGEHYFYLSASRTLL